MPIVGLPRNKDIETEKHSWGTPLDLFGYLDGIYHFKYDLAATIDNTLCYNFYSAGGIPGDITVKDGADYTCMGDLISGSCHVPIHSTCFMNPDYSRKIVDRMMLQALIWSEAYDNVVVCLVPFCGSDWFKRYALEAATIEIIGRVKYVGYNKDGSRVINSPPYDSCIVTFIPKLHDHILSKFERDKI